MKQTIFSINICYYFYLHLQNMQANCFYNYYVAVNSYMFLMALFLGNYIGQIKSILSEKTCKKLFGYYLRCNWVTLSIDHENMR